MKAKRALQLLVSLAVGGALMVLAFRNAPFDETWGEIRGVAWWGHAAVVVSLLLQFVVRSKRWAIQVDGHLEAVLGAVIPGAVIAEFGKNE